MWVAEGEEGRPFNVPSRRTGGGGSAAPKDHNRLENEATALYSDSTMRNAKLTFLFALFGPLTLGSMACFLTTEGERYDYDSYGYDTDGGCPVGNPGCPCTNTGVCNDGFECNPMINTCIHDSCPVGSPGCPCTKGGSCDQGFLCKQNYCVSEKPCNDDYTGTEGCQCTMNGGCDPGLVCLSQTCVDAGGTSGDSGGNQTTATTSPTTTSPGTTSDEPGTTDDGADSSTGEPATGGLDTGSTG